MTLTPEALEEFRSAWLSFEGNDFASRLQRQSLRALAAENEQLKVVLFALENKAQSELDLHLDGEIESSHETNAASFAALISGIAEAVKEVAKHQLGVARRASTLRVLAPSVGSVRLVLRAAPPEEDEGQVARATRTPSVDSKSLEAVATILARAQSEPDAINQDDVLSGLAADLPHKAHQGLKRVAKSIERQDWKILGELKTVSSFQPIGIDTHGAHALLRVLEENQESSTTAVLTGIIDGQRRSLGALWFTPDGQRSIEAAVSSRELMEQVAQHAASSEKVLAEFDVISIVGKGAAAQARSVYTLRSIKPAPKPEQTLFDSN